MPKYKKIKEIGKGNFGVVDLVEDAKGRKWAMKTFTPPALPGVTAQELRARFEREVRYKFRLNIRTWLGFAILISNPIHLCSLWIWQTVA